MKRLVQLAVCVVSFAGLCGCYTCGPLGCLGVPPYAPGYGGYPAASPCGPSGCPTPGTIGPSGAVVPPTAYLGSTTIAQPMIPAPAIAAPTPVPQTGLMLESLPTH